MTESGKVATNSDGQLRFVQSASPGLGCRRLLVVSLILLTLAFFSILTWYRDKTATPLCSVLFV